MKTSEIKNLTTEELQSRIAEEKAMLDNIKFNHTISPLDNPMSIRAKRRDIARMMTEANNRVAAAEAQA